MSAPEFSRPFRLDAIGETPRAVVVEAGANERAALARRFALVSLEALSGEARLRRGAGAFHAEGRLSARVTQACVATGEPVVTAIEEPFALRFVAAESAGEEIELDADALDTLEHDGQAIDLGEALAQTLALALDPFPRAPGAEAALRAAGVLSEGEAGPFGALAGLRERLTERR